MAFTYLKVSPRNSLIWERWRLLNMAFGVGAVEGVDGVGCGARPNFLPGIAIVTVIILLLIALGIVF